MCIPRPVPTLGWKGGLDVLYVLELINGVLGVATCDMNFRMIVLHAAKRLNIELDMLNGTE